MDLQRRSQSVVRPTFDHVSEKVTVIFPSGRPKRSRLHASLDSLKKWSVDVCCPSLEESSRWVPSLSAEYLCGTDEERSIEFTRALLDGESEAVWCGRGGYGATRILRHLEKTFDGSPAPRAARLLGYSDITALFAFLKSRHVPLECVHAPVTCEFPDHPRQQAVLNALRGVATSVPVQPLAGMKDGFHGVIWGGNLAVLASLCGTSWLPSPNGGAVLLEDVDEAPYRLDRFITQLYDSGFFKGIQGIFLGQFTRCGAKQEGIQVMERRCRELGLPLLGHLPVGHEPENLPLFLDRPYSFSKDSLELEPTWSES